jgi:hypothetical protein
MSRRFVALIVLALNVALFAPLYEAVGEGDPLSVLADIVKGGEDTQDGGGPVTTEGCQRSDDGKSCSKTGCTPPYECHAAPDGKCACIKPCGKTGKGNCSGGGCPPGEVCSPSGSACKCVKSAESCKLRPFETPDNPSGQACGGDCPPGLVCTNGTGDVQCQCAEPTGPKGTCTFVAHPNSPYCSGNCPSGRGRCEGVDTDDDGNWDKCECLENCKSEYAGENNCTDGVCFWGAVCNRVVNQDSKCDCITIIPPTPTVPSGDGTGVCCIKYESNSDCQMTDGENGEDVPATEIDGEDYRSGLFKCAPQRPKLACPENKTCKFVKRSNEAMYDCKCS